ncbi:hypothetical protein LPTSP4_34200 [Leptospira ryugenii]|uniref:Uncharacterized protein n=1 Tax=Leptospira ryugenii TaxID=1917863 RepID=A0A2P2E4U0_9LEPT|nr:Spy/CpxP family protein refolding chaperone [Leptospira ryugenii]GBF51882.1 hypothetical protein LPTSP4_34200 [Leptospira ryugenii]
MLQSSKFKKISLFALMTIVSLTVLANCRGHYSFEKRINWVADKLTSKLDLDDAQKTKLESIKTELIAKHKELDPQKENWVKEVVSQIRKDTIDTKVLDKLSTEQDKRHTEMRKFFQAKMIEFHAVLRPEQRQELGDLIEKFAKRFKPEE